MAVLLNSSAWESRDHSGICTVFEQGDQPLCRMGLRTIPPLTGFSDRRREEHQRPWFPWRMRDRAVRGCYPGLSVTHHREEGGDERHNSTWSVRPAVASAGVSSVVLAGSPLAVPLRHHRPTGYEPSSVGRTHAGTRNTGTWDRRRLPRLDVHRLLATRGSCGPRQHQEDPFTGVLSAKHGRPPTDSARSPVPFLRRLQKPPASFLLACLRATALPNYA